MTDEELNAIEANANLEPAASDREVRADLIMARGWSKRLVAEVRRLREEMAPRIVAVLGGGDWTDASVSHIRVPAGIDLKALEKEWESLRRAYLAGLSECRRWQSDGVHAGKSSQEDAERAVGEWRETNPGPPDFSDWLVANHGAKPIDVEEINDGP